MALVLLADENLPRDLVAALRRAGCEVAWLAEDNPGADDRHILERAQAERRLLLTFDKDFGELAFLHGLPAESGIILIRLIGESPEATVHAITSAVLSRDDWAGSFSVIEEGRLRMTDLPHSS